MCGISVLLHKTFSFQPTIIQSTQISIVNLTSCTISPKQKQLQRGQGVTQMEHFRTAFYGTPFTKLGNRLPNLKSSFSLPPSPYPLASKRSYTSTSGEMILRICNIPGKSRKIRNESFTNMNVLILGPRYLFPFISTLSPSVHNSKTAGLKQSCW